MYLSVLEYEPEHRRVRLEELRQVQKKVSELQTELLEAQNSPERMAHIVEEALKQTDTGDAAGKKSATLALPKAREDCPGV